MRPLRFVVIGLSGYAAVHLQAVHWLAQQQLGRLTGVIALPADRKNNVAAVRALTAQGVEWFASIDDFFARPSNAADILAIPIGIHQHASVSRAALQAGLHVYCEKPLAATVQEIDQLIAVRELAGRKLAVGFQHIYSPSIQQLKARISAGRLGRVQSITLLCSSPRSLQYYRRNDWAGKMRCAGNWVLDSPANNAHAHFLLNMLYLASARTHAADSPLALRAELYRANPIASCDTVQMEFTTREGVHCHAILTHACAHELGPFMRIVGEKGCAVWQPEQGKTLIECADGASELFDNGTHAEWRYEGFKDLLHAIQHQTGPLCSAEIARCHTLAINAMHESCPSIVAVPSEFLEHAEDWQKFPPHTKGNFHRVRDLDQYLQAAFEQNAFLSELGIPWARAAQAQWVELEGYAHFPGLLSNKPIFK